MNIKHILFISVLTVIINGVERGKEKNMNYDITFCSKKDCNNKECLRNQNNYDFSNLENHPISISLFEECEHWKE